MIMDIFVLLILAAAVGAGVGGGGLLVVYLTLLRDFAQVPAQAVNLAFFIISAISSAAVQMKNHTLPDLRLILLCSGAAIPGVFLGTFLRNQMSGDSLRMAFGALLLITAFIILRREFKAEPILRRHHKNAEKRKFHR